MNLRILLPTFAILLSGATAQNEPTPKPTPAIVWHDVESWGVEGKGFADTEAFYHRLPAAAKEVVNGGVWNLARQSSGLLVQFQTDATTIQVDHMVTSKTLAMPHMPASGVSGLDLYAKDEKGEWRWAGGTRPSKMQTQTAIASGLRPGLRDYRIYLPLYNGTEYLKIGVATNATFKTVAPRKAKPIVFYGTSITQGACASRPGMAHVAILGRRLDRPTINLGFSGKGRMEKEVGQFMVQIDAAVYVIDCVPNMDSGQVRDRTEPLVKQLRSAHPEVPIVLIEDRSYSNAWIMPARELRSTRSRDALHKAYMRMTNLGVKNLYYVKGDELLQGNDTTDGSHPSDLGFLRQADAIEPVLRKALGL